MIMPRMITTLIIAVGTAGCLTPADMPCYITVDGENVALTESREAAQEAVSQAIEMQSENGALDIEVAEDVGVYEASADLAEEPVSVSEAASRIELTVKTTEEVNLKESIEYTEKYRSEPELKAGELKIASQGHEGVMAVTKVLTKENGELLNEEVVDEEVLKEPVPRVILAGVDKNESPEGLSYDLSAEYEKLQMPVSEVNVTSHYGPRWGRNHNGTDFGLPTGAEIYAADGGTVYCSSYCGGFGNVVKIDHGNGMQTYYAHCSELLVSQGETVETGQLVALAGSTGNSTGPHLHFEVIINGTNMDPCNFLEFE